MRILALDTATEACSVALWNGQRRFELFELCPQQHTQRILPMVEQLLHQSGLELSQLQALAFGRGPGSFTGVRIGIGIAQGLALGADLPLLGISTLATMAEGAWRTAGASRVLAAIDARMGEVYWAQYQRDEQGCWQGDDSEKLLTPQEVNQRLQPLSGEWVTVGTGWQSYPDMARDCSLTLRDGKVCYPAAIDMLPLAGRLYQQRAWVAVEHSEPVYLRNSVAWKKRTEQAKSDDCRSMRSEM